MVLEMILPEISLVAVLTLKRFNATMREQMVLQMTFPSKRFATYVTWKRFHSHVCADVPVQVPVQRKSLSAVRALEWPLYVK